MSKTLSIRLPDDVADWLEHEANQRGRTKTDLIVSLVKVAMEGVYDAALQGNTQHDATQVQDKIDAAIAPLVSRIELLEARTAPQAPAPQSPAPPAPPDPTPPAPPAPPDLLNPNEALTIINARLASNGNRQIKDRTLRSWDDQKLKGLGLERFKDGKQWSYRDLGWAPPAH